MEKPRVVLFFPNTGFDIKGVSVDLPLAVLNLAAFIYHDFETVIIDQRVEGDWRVRLNAELAKKPLALGISAMTCPQILFGLEASLMASQISPETVRIWGGVHPTLMPKSTLRNALVDFIIRDQGEVPLKLVLSALRHNRRIDLTSFPSVSFVNSLGEYVETPLVREPRGRLDQFPSLPYELLKSGVETYVGSQGRFADPDARALIMIAAVGCPERCTYCAQPGMESTRTLVKESPENTARRVKELVHQFNINAVAFHDEEFGIDVKRMMEVARLLVQETGGRQAGFRWWCQLRMDSIERVFTRYGEEGIKALIASGLESFQPGIESGSQRILDFIKKRETVELFLRANKTLAQYPELQPLYNFMVGFPTETVDEMKATMKLAAQMIDDNPNAMIAGVYILVPYPGTEIFDVAVKAGFKPPETLEGWADFNRQQLLTPWVAGNPQILELAEFARLTSRFIDGKRLPRRLDHTLGGKSGLTEKDFQHLSETIRELWRLGKTSGVSLLREFNHRVLLLYDLGGALKNVKEKGLDSSPDLDHIISGLRGRLSEDLMGAEDSYLYQVLQEVAERLFEAAVAVSGSVLAGEGSARGADERAKELILDTSIKLGGDEIKKRDTEYTSATAFIQKFGPLPQREIIGDFKGAGIEEGKTSRFFEILKSQPKESRES